MRAKRLLSLVMALSMLFSLFAPSIVWAAEEGGHDVPLVESGGKNPAKVKTYKVSIRVSPSKAKAKVYVYDRRDDGNYADAQGTKYKSGLKLPAGDYHYIATAKGYLPAEGDFAVVDKNVRIKVRLEKEGQTPPLRISEEEPISNRDENELADGWYLAGTFNTWAPTADYQLIPNLDNVCSLTLTLTAEDEFKAVYVENGALKTESYYAGDDGPFSDDTNRNLRPGEAGEYTVYFRDVIDGDYSTKFLRATTLTDGKYYYIGSDIDWKKTGAIELQSVQDGSYSLYRAFDTDTKFKVLQCSEYGKLSWYGDSNGNNIYVDAGQYKILFDGAAVTVEQTYTITWEDEDGTELKKDHLVSGETPLYTDDPPTKASDAEHVYTFSGWTPEVVPVTGDATYKAVYSSVPTTVRLGSDRYFANVEDAVVAAPDGSTITLLASQTTYGFEVGALDGSSRSITLDLDKYDLTLQGNFGIVVEEGNALTITGTTGTLRNGAGAVTVCGTCTITGGRFDFDPSTWVPSTGYQVTKDTETYLWTVTRVTCELTLDCSPSQGTVTGAGEYPWGTEEVTITATPAEGYAFVRWEGNIDKTDPSYTFTITEDTYAWATFSGYYSLTATCSPAEGGAVVGTGTYAGLKEVTLRAVPAPGYRFTAWREGDEEIVSDEATYTFEMPDEDYSLTAVFEVDPDNQITEWNDVTVVVQGDPSKVSCSLWTKQNSLYADPRFGNDPNAWAVPLTKGRGKVPVGWHLGVDLEAQGSYSSSIAWTDEGGSKTLTEIKSSGLSSFDPSGSLGNGPVTMTLILDPVYLTLQPNGPAGVYPEYLKVPSDYDTPIMANPFTWEGHTFTGWNTQPDGSGTPYDDGASVTLTEDLTLYAQWAADSVYCTVSLSLKDCIDINFYVRDIPTADADSYTAVYTFKGKTTTVPLGEATPYSTDATAGTSVYRFTVASCAASEMTEEVVFDVKIGEASALSNGAISYSIQQYCDWVLDSSTETEELKELCQAVLDYGTYAQVRFGSANAPANANHSRDVITGNNWSAADRAALAAFRDSAYRIIPEPSDYPSWLAKITCSLSLKSRTELNFYYALKDGCSADTFAVVDLTVDGEAWTGGYRMTLLEATDPNAGPDRLKVTILNIPASKLGSVIVLGLEDQTKGGSITLTYSPMTYAANEDSSDFSTNEQANVNVCRALYRYYKAALAFFEQNN